jgi:cold shock CspA family protein
MLLGWEFEYKNDDGNKVSTRTSRELLQLATYPIAMHDVIDCGLAQNNTLISNLFVGADTKSESNNSESDSPSINISEILMVKNGYGFIKYPNNNLFFHYLDVEGEFNELQPYDRVTFEFGKNDKGQDVAKKVRKLTAEEIDAYTRME